MGNDKRGSVYEQMRLRSELEKSCSKHPKSGYILDKWGQYVPADLVEKLLLSLKHAIEIEPDPRDAFAVQFTYFGTLIQYNRLDEAEREIKSIISGNAQIASMLRYLAEIAAIRGDLGKASTMNELASHAPTDSNQDSEANLRREHELFGQNFRDSQIFASIDAPPREKEETAPLAEWEEFAVGFAKALTAGKFDAAWKMLSRDAKETWAAEDLQEMYEEMVSYFSDQPDYVEPVHSMTEWSAKVQGDEGWIHIAIADGAESEAVTVVVRREAKKLRISELEFGRP